MKRASYRGPLFCDSPCSAVVLYWSCAPRGRHPRPGDAFRYRDAHRVGHKTTTLQSGAGGATLIEPFIKWSMYTPRKVIVRDSEVDI
jgi:hypothetical protein